MVETTGVPGQLRRGLGLGSLTFYGVGLILGAGIYSILGAAAGMAGEALWQSFLLASIAALLTGLAYAELATMFPRAGAEYVYLQAAWPRVAWLPRTLGWVLVASGMATAATVSLAFAGYAALVVSFPLWVTAAALVAAATAINIVGITEASWVNIAFTLVEAAGLVALIVVGAREPEFSRLFATPPHPGVLGGAALIFFAYLGFEDIANLAEEARDPSRDIPLAILIAVAVSTALYVLVAAASVALAPPERLASSAAPVVEAVQNRAPGLAGALGAVALFATANTALITITVASRLLFSMARDENAPAALARTLPKRQTPALATIVASAGALLFLPVGAIAILGSVASLLALVAFASVHAALLRLRATRPHARRPFRVPLNLAGVPLPIVLGLLVVVALLTRFEAEVYAIAAVTFGLACLIQAIPWAAANRHGGQTA